MIFWLRCIRLYEWLKGPTRQISCTSWSWSSPSKPPDGDSNGFPWGDTPQNVGEAVHPPFPNFTFKKKKTLVSLLPLPTVQITVYCVWDKPHLAGHFIINRSRHRYLILPTLHRTITLRPKTSFVSLSHPLQAGVCFLDSLLPCNRYYTFRVYGTFIVRLWACPTWHQVSGITGLTMLRISTIYW